MSKLLPSLKFQGLDRLWSYVTCCCQHGCSCSIGNIKWSLVTAEDRCDGGQQAAGFEAFRESARQPQMWTTSCRHRGLNCAGFFARPASERWLCLVLRFRTGSSQISKVRSFLAAVFHHRRGDRSLSALTVAAARGAFASNCADQPHSLTQMPTLLPSQAVVSTTQKCIK